MRVAALLLTAFIAHGVRAEELSLLGGATDTDDHTSGSYAWGLEYRQRLLDHFFVSFGYLNEGHLPDHHRDGAMLQAWADTGPWLRRLAFSFGVGPYVYFDTRDDDDYAGYRDQHGVGMILTGRISYAISNQWFALLELNQIVATTSGTRTAMLGVGYRLDSFIEALDRAQRDPPRAQLANELGVFSGETTLNNLSSDKSTDFGIEYRYRPARHFEFSTSVINESDGAFGHHPGATAEAWVVQDFVDSRLTAGLGVGPYVSFSSYQTPDGRPGASMVGLASMTCSWRFTTHFALRVNWHRGFTGDDQDRDTITGGFAWRY
jgi:hypothetical protein